MKTTSISVNYLKKLSTHIVTRNIWVSTELEKIPYMLIVGENEKSEGTVSVRKQGEGDVGTMTIEAFAERIRSEIVEMLAV